MKARRQREEEELEEETDTKQKAGVCEEHGDSWVGGLGDPQLGQL